MLADIKEILVNCKAKDKSSHGALNDSGENFWLTLNYQAQENINWVAELYFLVNGYC